MRKLLLITVLLSLNLVGLNGQTRGTPSTLRVRVDANGYLVVASATQTNPVTSGTFSSRVLRTDASGNLQVILAGTVTPTYPQAIPASTCAAPSLGMSGGATTGIAFTATPSILMCIAGTAVQTITATSADFYSAAVNLASTGVITISNGGGLTWATRTKITSNADGLLNLISAGGTLGVQFNTGTAAPTVTSCGTGTVTTGSRNTSGEITATGATVCTVTFGAPAWTNTPFCTVTLGTAPTTALYISASSTTAFTVSGLTAGNKFTYQCLGRI